MRLVRTLALVVAVAPLVGTPVFAEKNSGRFNSQAHDQLCADLKLILDVAESEAAKRVGTKAAAKYSRQADQAWADGERQNCKWAK